MLCNSPCELDRPVNIFHLGWGRRVLGSPTIFLVNRGKISRLWHSVKQILRKWTVTLGRSLEYYKASCRDQVNLLRHNQNSPNPFPPDDKKINGSTRLRWSEKSILWKKKNDNNNEQLWNVFLQKLTNLKKKWQNVVITGIISAEETCQHCLIPFQIANRITMISAFFVQFNLIPSAANLEGYYAYE